METKIASDDLKILQLETQKESQDNREGDRQMKRNMYKVIRTTLKFQPGLYSQSGLGECFISCATSV